ESSSRERLGQGLVDGVIDIVVSDNSPTTLELKEHGNGSFDTAWGGISSLQLGLPVVWTEARQRGINLATVASWMADGPAQIAQVEHKGRVAVGYDADLVSFDPEATWTVDAGSLHHRNPITPYDRKELTGQVQATWLRRRTVDCHTPRGQFLRSEQPTYYTEKLAAEGVAQSCDMALGVDIVFNVLDDTILIDHKGRTEGAFKGLAVDGFFAVAAIRLGDDRIRIRQQRKGQLFLFGKSPKVCWPIRGDTDDLVSGAA